jgi:hypothetical protein
VGVGDGLAADADGVGADGGSAARGVGGAAVYSRSMAPPAVNSACFAAVRMKNFERVESSPMGVTFIPLRQLPLNRTVRTYLVNERPTDGALIRLRWQNEGRVSLPGEAKGGRGPGRTGLSRLTRPAASAVSASRRKTPPMASERLAVPDVCLIRQRVGRRATSSTAGLLKRLARRDSFTSVNPAACASSTS